MSLLSNVILVTLAACSDHQPARLEPAVPATEPPPQTDCVGDCASANPCPETTCDQVGAACGTVCGQACGRCPGSQKCAAGRCVESSNCPNCLLSLTVLDGNALAVPHRDVLLGVDFEPESSAMLPRIIELRVRVEGPAKLIAAHTGQALRQAGKALYRDSYTGNSYQKVADGTYRLLVISTSSAEEIRAGRLAELHLRVTGAEPINVRILRRNQVFAPAAANAILQASSYDAPLTVRP